LEAGASNGNFGLQASMRIACGALSLDMAIDLSASKVNQNTPAACSFQLSTQLRNSLLKAGILLE